MATNRVFSQEDGKLNTRPIITSRTKSYSDIDLTFAKKTDGDIFKKTDAAAVKQAVKNLLLTNRMEKPFDPSYGGDLNRFIFELSTDIDEFQIRDQIINTIVNYEPRAIPKDVEVIVSPDQNDVSVLVRFQVINVAEVQELNITLTRLR